MAVTGREMIEAARREVPTMSNTDLHHKLASGEPIVVLDVRELEEWNSGHIPQGTLLARGRLEGRIEEIVPDKSTPIVTH
jgi:rhodanese-related sulfurtransferase